MCGLVIREQDTDSRGGDETYKRALVPGPLRTKQKAGSHFCQNYPGYQNDRGRLHHVKHVHISTTQVYVTVRIQGHTRQGSPPHFRVHPALSLNCGVKFRIIFPSADYKIKVMVPRFRAGQPQSCSKCIQGRLVDGFFSAAGHILQGNIDTTRHISDDVLELNIFRLSLAGLGWAYGIMGTRLLHVDIIATRRRRANSSDYAVIPDEMWAGYGEG